MVDPVGRVIADDAGKYIVDKRTSCLPACRILLITKQDDTSGGKKVSIQYIIFIYNL